MFTSSRSALQLGRSLASSAPVATKTATQAAHQKSLANVLFGDQGARSSMSDQIPFDKVAAPRIEEEQIQRTLLSNGVTVYSIDNNSPVAQIGVQVGVGSRDENPQISGITNFLERATLRSSQNRSHFRLVREMNKVGCNLSVRSSRERMFFQGTAIREHVPYVLGTFADLQQNHAYDQVELREVRAECKEFLSTYDANNPEYMTQLIHEAAYGTQGLGLPQICGDHNLERFDADLLNEFTTERYTADRLLVGGVGIDHQTLVNLATDMFGSVPKGSYVTPESKFVGGEVRDHNPADPLAHVALVTESVPYGSADLYAVGVLGQLLGGGGSFSTGGPGKGMYTRLYKNVLCQHSWVEKIERTFGWYHDTGYFGIQGSCDPHRAGEFIQVIHNEMTKLVENATEAEVARAKNQLKSRVLQVCGQDAAQMEDMLLQALTGGEVLDHWALLRNIDRVTADDLSRLAKQYLSGPIALAAAGDLSHLPRLAQINTGSSQ